MDTGTISIRQLFSWSVYWQKMETDQNAKEAGSKCLIDYW